MKNYIFEGKSEEAVILTALKELGVKEEELFYKIEEEKIGLLKKKKYKLNAILKTDVLNYSKNLLKDLTSSMGLEIQIETLRKEKYLKLILHTENPSILIGKNGRTLNSFQNIIRQSILNKTSINANIILDVENYKEKRDKTIEFLAKKIAKEVKNTGVEVKMDSMNSYERRIVHNILSNYKGITTISEGEEPNRCVVVKSSK